MELRICSLSGVAVATLPAGPLETVADLKEKFAHSTSLKPLCEVKFLMGGTVLDEKCRLEELQLGAAAELHVIQSLKSAREILFSSTEVAFELAKQYNALQDQCAERIGSLFLDQQGNPRSHMANIEVLLALEQKLSQPQGDLELAEFKGALTTVALAALVGIEGPFGMGRQAFRGQFIRCFAWLGLAAVEALLGQISSSQLYNVPEPAAVESLLIREFAQLPAGSLQHLKSQLSRNDISGTSQLEVIFEKAVAEAAQAAKKKMEAKQTPRTLHVRTCRCSVCSHGRVETIQELAPMVDSDEVLRVVRRRPCKFITAGQEVEVATSFPDAGNLVIWPGCRSQTHSSGKKALRNAVLTAIEQEPDMILPHVDQALALAAVQKYPGTYRYLPEAFKMDRDILYAALKCDHSLRAEFLSTAGNREIRQWQWHVAGGDRLQKKVCRVK